MTQQKQIDFLKCQRVAAIRDLAHVPKGHGTRLQTVKLVLLCIEDHYGNNGQAWPSQTTMAQFAGVKVRAVRYAIEWLESAGLLSVHSRNRVIDGEFRTVNHYSILWGNLCEWNENHATDRQWRADRSAMARRPIGNGAPTDRQQLLPPNHHRTTNKPSLNPHSGVVPEKDLVVGGLETAGRDYDRTAKRLALRFGTNLTVRDKQILNRVLDEVQAGYITYEQIDKAICELDRSQANYPVSVFERILERHLEMEHCK